MKNPLKNYVFRVKATYLPNVKAIVRKTYKVPKTFEELEKLPGVGHKTASVVMSQGFGYPALRLILIFIDLHKDGFNNGKNVVQTEKDLKRIFPKNVSKLHLQIIFMVENIVKQEIVMV